MVEDLMCLQLENSGRSAKQPRLNSWKKPAPGWCKVNTDASFQASSAIGACGAVVRDEDGRMLAAGAKHYPNVADVLTGEFLAARDGLILAAQQGCSQIVLESDNLSLVRMMQATNGDRSAVLGLRQEIQELSRSFRSLSFSFIHREGNGVAHVCARLASTLEPVCLENFPLRLLQAAGIDCNPDVI